MKFNITVEYDIYDDFDRDQLDELIAEKLASQIIFQCGGDFEKRFGKIETRVKNEVVREMINKIYEDVPKEKFEKKFEDKLQREFSKQSVEGIERRVEKNMNELIEDELQNAVKKEVNSIFKKLG